MSQVALALALACSAGTLSAVLVEGMFWGPVPGRAERVRIWMMLGLDRDWMG